MKPRVLVVDDNEALAENIAELFEDAGTSTQLVADAESADAVARSHGFDLAIIDLRLPGVSGVELLPMLRRACPDGEVVLITGNATLDTAIEAVRQGVFAYVQKPFDPDDLLALGLRALAQVSLKQERAALARELAQSEAVHRGVVESVPALIVGIDDEGRVQFVNQFTARTLGWRPRDVRGKPFLEVAAVEDDRAALEDAVRRARRGDRPNETELRVSSRSGETRVVRWMVVPLLAESGARLVLAIGTDVTERIALERRTAQSEAMATMGTLTAGLAHEIRNPLNAAKLQLELLSRSSKKVEDQDVASRMRDRVRIVQEELSRLSAMLDDFLALARPRGIERRPFLVMPLVAEVVQLQGPLAHDQNVQIGLVPGAWCDVEVVGDRAKVKQVLVNLIGNAVDAMRGQHGGLITIDAHADPTDRAIEIRVTDTGPGIPDGVAHQLFQPFVSMKEAGTGLGLAIVKNIVEQHGGRVQIERAEPRGTTVRFTLPTR